LPPSSSIFYFSNYATPGSGSGSSKTTITRNTDFNYIDNDTNSTVQYQVYNVTVPVLAAGAGAMELPLCAGNTDFVCTIPAAAECPHKDPFPYVPNAAKVGCLDWGALDLAIDVANGNKLGEATMIALHPQEIIANPDFGAWMDTAIAAGYSFVTVSNVLSIKAGVPYTAPTPYGPFPKPTTCEMKSTIDSDRYTGYASLRRPAPYKSSTAEVPAYTTKPCDLACETADGEPNPDYGGGCYTMWNTPVGSTFFKTYIPMGVAGCEPRNFTPPKNWAAGSYPWTGNPTGNMSVRGDDDTDASYCNTFPQKACQPLDLSARCALPAPAACINAAPYKEWAKGGVPGTTKNFCVTYEGKTYRCDADKGFEVDCNEFVPGSPSARGYWSPST
jgi:hypothetical protein